MIDRKAQKGLGRKYIFIHARCAFNVAVNRGRATYIGPHCYFPRDIRYILRFWPLLSSMAMKRQ